MSVIRPYVLSIAGHDPSGGAGLLADIKTFESCNTYGLGVCTSITFQNEDTFTGMQWLSKKNIFSQIDILLNQYDVKFAKIGLIENLSILIEIVEYLNSKNIKVIWDPILKTTTGFTFHISFNDNELKKVLSNIYLITPNLEEIKILTNEKEVAPEYIQEIIRDNNICSVLLKGGHAVKDSINDVLIKKDAITVFKGEKYKSNSKHGTGCVLSSAIAANLSLGKDLITSCKNAKEYIHRFILSNKTKLGYHT